MEKPMDYEYFTLEMRTMYHNLDTFKKGVFKSLISEYFSNPFRRDKILRFLENEPRDDISDPDRRKKAAFGRADNGDNEKKRTAPQ